MLAHTDCQMWDSQAELVGLCPTLYWLQKYQQGMAWDQSKMHTCLGSIVGPRSIKLPSFKLMSPARNSRVPQIAPVATADGFSTDVGSDRAQTRQ